MRRTWMALSFLALAVAAPAVGQVVVMPVSVTGDLSADDRQAFDDRLRDRAERASSTHAIDVLPFDAAWLDGADCNDASCATAIGERVPASAMLFATVNAEAEIYDFEVRVVGLADGEGRSSQTGDCTFCPVAEALDGFGFAADAALAGARPLPPATRGPARADAEPVVEPPPPPAPVPVVVAAPPTPSEPPPTPPPVDVASTVEAPSPPAPAPAPAFAAGDLPFGVRAVPADATIALNGETVGQGDVSVMVAPQRLIVTVSADGYAPYTEEVVVGASAAPVVMRVALAVDAGGRAARSTDGSSFRRRAVGGILVTTGVLSIASAAVMASFDGDPACSDGDVRTCTELYEFTAAGTATALTGGALIAAGISSIASGLSAR